MDDRIRTGSFLHHCFFASYTPYVHYNTQIGVTLSLSLSESSSTIDSPKKGNIHTASG